MNDNDLQYVFIMCLMVPISMLEGYELDKQRNHLMALKPKFFICPIHLALL